MPFKRKFSRSKKFKPKMGYGKKRHFKKRGKRSGSSTVIKIPSFNRMIVPDRMRVKLHASATFYRATAAAAQEYFDVFGNDITLPFATGESWDSVTGFAGVGTTGQVPSATNQPTGLSIYLGANQLYARYRVLASSIKVNVISQATVDSGWVAIVPYIGSFTANTTVATASSAPYSKGPKMVTPGQVNSGRLSSYLSSSRIFGVAKRALYDDINYSGTYSASPTQLWYWRVIYTDGTNGALTAPQCWEVRMSWYIEFHNQQIGGLPET